MHTPLYARIWLHVHVFIVNRSILFSQSGRGTGLQYHKGRRLFAYCIRDRAMNSRAHEAMRIYKSRWYTRAKPGAAPYPKELKKHRRFVYTNVSMLCTSAPLPPWRSQQSPAQLVDLLADLGHGRVSQLRNPVAAACACSSDRGNIQGCP